MQVRPAQIGVGRGAVPDDEERQGDFTMKLLGEGGVRQIARRKWECWQYVENDSRRSQRTRRVDGGKRDALKCLENLRAELSEQVPNSETFAAYAARWALWRASSGEFAPGTTTNDKTHINVLNRVLGEKRMDEVDAAMLRDALSTLRNGGSARGKTLSGTYMGDLYDTLSSIFGQAEADGAITRDPTRSVRRPKVDTREREWMPPVEFETFVQNLLAMEPDARVLACIIMAEQGLRRGEACALYDGDVDTANAVMHVRRAVKERDGSIGQPKSECGKRDLPMSARCCAAVDKWREEREKRGLSDAPTLCCSATGTVLRPQNLQRWWDAERDALGASGFTLHQIRHSNLSKMARFFNSPYDLRDWAGWSSLEPAKVYIHRDFASMRAGLARAEAFTCGDVGEMLGFEKQARGTSL